MNLSDYCDYIVVCEHFHGYAGPFTKADADEFLKRVNAPGAPCKYVKVVNATQEVARQEIEKMLEGGFDAVN